MMKGKSTIWVVTLVVVCLEFGLVNLGHAKPPYGDEVDAFCPSKPFSGNCMLCHVSDFSTMTPEKDAFLRGDLCFFCPNDEPCNPGPSCTDSDTDGYALEGGVCGPVDCDDGNAAVNPSAAEDCMDGIDNNCNGLVDSADPNAIDCPATCTDVDGDLYSVEGGVCGPVDCDDGNAAVNPGAAEDCTDGIDNNCNHRIDRRDRACRWRRHCTDEDGDGYSIEGRRCGRVDCNDADPAIRPGAEEICNDGVDNNCNRRVDRRDWACWAQDDDDCAGGDDCDQDDDLEGEDEEEDPEGGK